jgi:vancomycin permeability regulator SanA
MTLKQIILIFGLVLLGLHINFIINLAKIIRFTNPNEVPYNILGIVITSSILVYLYNKFISND